MSESVILISLIVNILVGEEVYKTNWNWSQDNEITVTCNGYVFWSMQKNSIAL